MKFKILKTSALLFFLSFFLTPQIKADELKVFFVDTVLSKTEVVNLGSKKVVMMLFEVKGPASTSVVLDTIQIAPPPTELPKKLFFAHEVKDPSEIEKLPAFTGKPVLQVAVPETMKQRNGTISIQQIYNKDNKPYLMINGVNLYSPDSISVSEISSSPAQALPVFKKIFDFFGVLNDSDLEEVPGNSLIHNSALALTDFVTPEALNMALYYNLAFAYWNDEWYKITDVYERLSAQVKNDKYYLEIMWALSKTKTFNFIKEKYKGVDARIPMDIIPHPQVYDYALKEFSLLSVAHDKEIFLDYVCLVGGCYGDEKLKDFLTQGLKIFEAAPKKDQGNIDWIKPQLTLFQKREFNHLYDLPTLMKYIETLDKSDEDEEEIYEYQRLTITGTFVENEMEEFNTYILETKIGEYKVLVNFVASVEDMVNVKKGDTLTVSGLIDMVMFDEDEEEHTKEIEIDLLLSEVSKK